MTGPNFSGPWWLNQQTAEIIYSKTPPGNPRVGNVFLGFATKADAQAYLKKVDPSGKTGPGTLLTPPHGNLPNPVKGIEQFLGLITQRQTWVRIAEGVLGLVLILVGIAELAKGTQTGKIAAGALKKVALA